MPSCLDNKATVVFSGCYPMGFNNEYAFANFIFGLANYSDMPDDAQILFQGSSVTGVSWESRKPFDEGRVSDFDVALASELLWARVLQSGMKTRPTTSRTGELQDSDLDALQLRGVLSRANVLVAACSTKVRPIHLMVFKDQASATKSKVSLATYMDTSKPKGKRQLLTTQLCGTL